MLELWDASVANPVREDAGLDGVDIDVLEEIIQWSGYDFATWSGRVVLLRSTFEVTGGNMRYGARSLSPSNRNSTSDLILTTFSSADGSNNLLPIVKSQLPGTSCEDIWESFMASTILSKKTVE